MPKTPESTLPGTTETCRKCTGHGVVGDGPDMRPVDCPQCHGRGYVRPLGLECIVPLGGTWLATCEDCGGEHLLEGMEDVFDAWAELRARGWEIVRESDEDEWRYSCPTCTGGD